MQLENSELSAVRFLTIRLAESITAFLTPWPDPLNNIPALYSLFFENAMSDRLPSVYLSINLSFVKLFYISLETVLPSIPHSSVTSIRLASAVQILAQAPYRGSYRVFGPVRNYGKTK